MHRVNTDTLKNLNNLEKLTELFCRDLNYTYSNSVISKRTWKEQVSNSVKELSLIATHNDFHIIYCQVEKLLLGIERPIINCLLKEHPYLLVIFSDPQFTNWHFVNVKYDEELKSRRLFRRIVIGPDERLHTAAQRINMLEVVDEKMQALELQIKHDKAFDVEEVTKEFYEKYTDIFHTLSDDIAEENPQIDSNKEAQIILDRLLFLYFIQKKGWLNNNKRYLYENFLRFWKKDPKGNSFYSEFLVKLFQALSCKDNLFRESLGDIPFLNGGLFEVDPFHSKLPFRLIIRNDTFKQIFDDLLERFNFTVREDTPLDVEVAIDPEMLGKIFENLVLKLEKGEDLRKKTGSYYTPRVIVHFMCQESLKEYLISESEIERHKIETLFSMEPPDQLTEEEIGELKNLISIPQARLLRNIINKAYILDPAVGSGAFLVGMLHEMVSILKLLDVCEFGKDFILRPNYDYELKRQLIETSLYGVDIQEQAVRICELRLWLSLIVDYEKIQKEEIPPLPNLSYKIRCGDSLIEKLFGHNVQLDQLVHSDKGKQLIDEITKDKEAYFLARDIKEKNRIELTTLAKQCELMELLIKEKQKALSGVQLSFLEETAKERKKREEFEKAKREYENILLLASNTKKKVEAMLKGKISIPAEDIHDLKKKLGISFIWKLDFAEVFKEKGGFDIVIGNPPYIVWYSRQAKKISRNEEMALRTYYNFLRGESKKLRIQSVMFFLEKGYDLARERGIITYIVDFNFHEHPFLAIRKYLVDKVKILTIVNGIQGFVNVASGQVIIVLEKSNQPVNQHKVKIKEGIGGQIALVQQKYFNNIQRGYKWNFDKTEDIINKIEKDSLPLSRKLIVNSGVAVNATKEGKKLFILPHKDNKCNCFPLLEGGKSIPYSFCKPRFYSYLNYDKKLEKELNDLFDKNYYKRKFSHQRPFNIRDIKEFDRPKIFLRQSDFKLTATYSEDLLFSNYSIFHIFDANNDKRKIKFILGIINSKLMTYYAIKRDIILIKPGKIPQIRSGQRGPLGIRQLPIKHTSPDVQREIINLVDRIIAIHNKGFSLSSKDWEKVNQLENQIDQKVYELYGLTEEEINIVEESVKT